MSDIVNELREAHGLCHVGTDINIGLLLDRAAAEIESLRAELAEAKAERDNFLEFAKEQCSYCIGHPSGVFEHYTGERIARYIKSRITDKMLLDGFIADRKTLSAMQEGK